MATSEELFTPHKADKLLIVKFYHDAKENKKKSFKAGRPVFDDIEMVEINLPADRARSVLAPAHMGWRKFGPNTVTYAQRFPEHYARFKANEGPVIEGTPLNEAPFLTVADKKSLQALQVYTVEQLAQLTGQALKNIGHGGLVKQQQAVAYLAKANGTANVAVMQNTIEDLHRQIAELKAAKPEDNLTDVPPVYEEMDATKIKDHIEAKTGVRPKGNPSLQTLVMMAYELDKEPETQAA